MSSENISSHMGRSAVLLLVLGLFAGCAAVGGSSGGAITTPADVAEIRPGILAGYLSPEDYPDSLGLVPPPPAADSAAQALDSAINERMLTLKDTPRFHQAARDNELRFPAAAETFACALGFSISAETTPFTYQLLRRSLADAGLATYAAKNHHQRQRPFLTNGAANCAHEEEQAMLARDGSYPSGHSAIGWAWALILTELVPERRDAILRRGIAYSESRVVCNVHWPSDIQAGRTIGAAAVAALHANAVFLADLAMAKRELAQLSSGGVPAACPLDDSVLYE